MWRRLANMAVIFRRLLASVLIIMEIIENGGKEKIGVATPTHRRLRLVRI